MFDLFRKDSRLEPLQKSWLSKCIKNNRLEKDEEQHPSITVCKKGQSLLTHMLDSPTMSTSSRQKGLLSCPKRKKKEDSLLTHCSVGLCLHSLHFRHSYESNTNDQAHDSHKHVAISFLPPESPTVCPGMFSSYRLWESVISLNKKIKTFGEMSDAERRQGDCLPPTAGWMREKCQECRESIGFLRRKETRARTLPTNTKAAEFFWTETILGNFNAGVIIKPSTPDIQYWNTREILAYRDVEVDRLSWFSCFISGNVEESVETKQGSIFTFSAVQIFAHLEQQPIACRQRLYLHGEQMRQKGATQTQKTTKWCLCSFHWSNI